MLRRPLKHIRGVINCSESMDNEIVQALRQAQNALDSLLRDLREELRIRDAQLLLHFAEHASRRVRFSTTDHVCSRPPTPTSPPYRPTTPPEFRRARPLHRTPTPISPILAERSTRPNIPNNPTHLPSPTPSLPQQQPVRRTRSSPIRPEQIYSNLPRQPAPVLYRGYYWNYYYGAFLPYHPPTQHPAPLN